MRKWRVANGEWRGKYARMSYCAAALLTICLCGCGYHVAGHNNTLPKTIHVIAVPALENKTTGYRVEQKLTTALIHEFLVKTTYHVVSDANAGDAVLTGKVVSMEVLPLLFNNEVNPATGAQTAQATAMLITIKCEVTFTDRLTQKVLYHTDDFVFRNQYELASVGSNNSGTVDSNSIESFFQEGDPAVDRMSKDFASRLVTAIMENY